MGFFHLSVFALLASVASPGLLLRGQSPIVVDSTFGKGGTVPNVGNNFDIGANLGRTVGANLFHSFDRFNVPTNNTATFSGPAGIRNVLSRVTGAEASNIDGTIRSTIPNADLYLINPNGVVFGRNAKLETSGSFHATTANTVKLKDGGQFHASNPSASVLTSAPPSAFGFLPGPAAPKAIAVQGSQLSVPAGKAVSFVGGDVRISGGARITAPAGRINLVSVASAGDVGFDPESPGAPMDVSTITSRGKLDIVESSALVTSDDGTVVDAEGRGGGLVFLRAGDFTLDNSSISARVEGAANGRGVDAEFTGRASLLNGSFFNLDTLKDSSGAAGNVSLTAREIIVTGQNANNATAIGSSSLGAGAAGSISLTATDRFELSDNAFVNSSAFSSGAAGTIALTTKGSAQILSGGRISVTSEPNSTGGGGTINIQAGDLLVSGTGTRPSGIFSTNSGTGQSGVVFVPVGGGLAVGGNRLKAVTIQLDNSLEVSDDARIDVSTFGPGGAGLLQVRAGGAVNLLRGGFIAANSGSSNNAPDALLGSGGSIGITAQSFTAGGTGSAGTTSGIVVQAYGRGPGGLLSLRTTNEITLDADSSIASNNYGSGRGGSLELTVSAGNLTVANGASILANTSGSGQGGSVRLTASGLVRVAGIITTDVGISPENADSPEAALATNTASTGRGGNIQINARDLTVDTGTISADTYGAGTGVNPGPGGNVTLTLSGDLLVTNPSTDPVGYITADTLGTGHGGTVNVVRAANITLSKGGFIGVDVYSSGAGGDVLVNASGAILLKSGGNITSFAFPESTGKAGNVQSTSGQLTVTGADSLISTSTLGRGAGGDLKVTTTAGPLRVLAGSNIASETGVPRFDQTENNTVRTSTGGTVTINAPSGVLISGANSAISARTAGAADAGRINLASNSLEVSEGGTLTASTTGAGNAGNNLSVNVSGPVRVLSGGTITASAGAAESFSGLQPDTTTQILTNQGFTSGGVAVVVQNIANFSAALLQLTPTSGRPPASPFTNLPPGNTTPTIGSAGRLTLAAVDLTVDGPGSQISANSQGTQVNAARGNLTLGLSGSLTVSNGGALSTNTASGVGGDQSITVGGGLRVLSGGQINATTSSATKGTGAAGITLDVKGDSLISGRESAIRADSTGRSNAGVISLTGAGGLTVADAGQITTNSLGRASASDGTAGQINLRTGGDVQLLSGGQVAAVTTRSGAGGGVLLTAPALTIDAQNTPAGTPTGIIATSSGTGRAGDALVSVNDLTVRGTGAGINANTTGAGAGGDVILSVARSAQFTDGGSVSATTAAGGNGGNIFASIGGDARFAGGSIVADSDGAGRSGSVTVRVGGAAEFTAGGSLSAGGSGGGGDVVLNVAGPASFNSGGAVSANTSAPDSGGNVSGGNVNVFVGGTTALASGASLSASTSGVGTGGNVTLNTRSLELDNAGILATSKNSTGTAGSIKVSTSGSVILRNGAQVSVSTDRDQPANSGGITLAAGGQLNVSGNSTISAIAGRNAGDITLQAGPGTIIQLTEGSRITASAIGGTGGSVEIARAEFLVVQNATLTASAAGTGSGGKITNQAPVFASTSPGFIPEQIREGLVDPNFRPFDEQGLNNVFNVQSAAGPAGVVVTAAPGNTLASSLTPLTNRTPNLLVLAQYPASASQEAAAREVARKYLEKQGVTPAAETMPPTPAPSAPALAESQPPPASASATVRSPERAAATPSRRARPAPETIAARLPERVRRSRVIAVEVPKRAGSKAAAAIILIDPVTQAVKSDVYEIAKRPLAGEEVPLGAVSATFVNSGGSSGPGQPGVLQP